jgi:hypothetical protein
MTLSRWAACSAARASLATLIVTTYVTGRREQSRWKRESLTEAFVAFLDASWRGTDALRGRLVGGGVAASDMDRDAARRAYDDMRNQLTRLRLLTSGKVVGPAEELLRHHRTALNAGGDTLQEALSAASAGRRAVIRAGKQELRLDGT